MISLPLASLGYDISGYDTDKASIEYGRKLFVDAGLDPSRLVPDGITSYPGFADVIIASEVIEHIPDSHMDMLISDIRNKLKPAGRLLVTVPNGYGWFELESYLWHRLKIGSIISFLQIPRIAMKIKTLLIRNEIIFPPPSSLDSSIHVQRFTSGSITKLFERNGFRVEEITGSVIFAGPFSDILFTGVGLIMSANRKLGDLLPSISSGFYLFCVRE